MIHGAELLNCEGCPPLEVSHFNIFQKKICLKINIFRLLQMFVFKFILTRPVALPGIANLVINEIQDLFVLIYTLLGIKEVLWD